MTGLPTWNDFAVPVLQLMEDGSTRPKRGIVDGVIRAVALTDEQLALTLPSSGERTADNRIGWAISYLTRVQALARPQRGHYSITPKGHEVLRDYAGGLSESDFRDLALPGDEWWLKKRSTDEKTSESGEADGDGSEGLDPREQVEQGVARIHADVAADLLSRLQEHEPAFFEHAVVKLLVAMGYGGADGRATVTRISGDGGIDGVIDRDALGLDRVYIQAKRYADSNPVGRPDIQRFVGALSGKASTGVFITTGRFSPAAAEYAEQAHTRVILIDGGRLAGLMIRYNVGVQARQVLKIVEVDEDFFE